MLLDFSSQAESIEEENPTVKGLDFSSKASAVNPVNPVQKPQDITEGLVSRLTERAKKIYGLSQGKYGDGKDGLPVPLRALPIAGQIGSGLSDIVTTGIGEYASAATPDWIEEPVKKYLSSAVGGIADSHVGDYIGKGVEYAKELAGQFPATAETLGGAIGVAEGIPVIAGAKAITPAIKEIGKVTAKGIGKVGQGIEDIANRQQKSFVEELIMPKQTAKVKVDQVGRTVETGGILGGRKVKLSPKEQEIADEVVKIKGISPSNTIQGNQNIVKIEIGKEAKRLSKKLADKNVIFPRVEFKRKLDAVIKGFEYDPSLVGDSGKTAIRIADKFKTIANNHPSTPSGLFEARKEFDKVVKSFKPKAFDPKSENAFSTALRSIRNITHDFISSKVPDIEVKNSLRKQSNLFGAIDNLSPKSAAEANTRVGRFIQSLPIKSETSRIIATLGLGGGITTAPLAVAGIGAGIVAYKSAKELNKPQVKFAIAKLLKGADKIVNDANNPSIKKQLIEDRSLLKDAIKNLKEQQAFEKLKNKDKGTK